MFAIVWFAVILKLFANKNIFIKIYNYYLYRIVIDKNIAYDFITNLLSCKNDDCFYRHIFVIIDMLFKLKKFILINFINI